MANKNKGNIVVGAGKQTIYIAAGKIIALIATFGLQLFLTRYLTKYEYGLYSQVFTVAFFVATIFSFGIQSNLFFFYPNESKINRRIYVFQTLSLLVVFSIIAAFALSIPIIFDFFSGGGVLDKYKLIIVICVILIIPTFITDTLYVVNKDLKVSIIFPPIKEILKLLFLIIIVALFQGFIAVIYALLIALLLPFIFSFYYSFIELRIAEKRKPLINFELLKAQLKYALPFGFAVIINTIIQRIDKVVSISYLSITDYASYSLAFFGVPGITQIYDSIAQVMITKMVDAFKVGDNKVLLKIYNQFTLKAFSFTIPVIIIVCLYSKKIILFLFTEKYIDTVPLFQVYLLSFIFGMFGSGIILRATGRTKQTLHAYLYSAIIVIPLTYFLIKNYGVWGGMSTALIGIGLPKIFMSFMELKEFNYKIREYIPWRALIQILLISILSVIPFAIIEYQFNYNIYYAIIFAVNYLFIVFLFELHYGLFIVDKDYLTSITKNYQFINQLLRKL